MLPLIHAGDQLALARINAGLAHISYAGVGDLHAALHDQRQLVRKRHGRKTVAVFVEHGGQPVQKAAAHVTMSLQRLSEFNAVLSVKM